jgi:hypothetical protein
LDRWTIKLCRHLSKKAPLKIPEAHLLIYAIFPAADAAVIDSASIWEQEDHRTTLVQL